MSNALFISPEAPYPLAGGGALRSASLLNFLASRYSLDMVVFREPPILECICLPAWSGVCISSTCRPMLAIR